MRFPRKKGTKQLRDRQNSEVPMGIVRIGHAPMVDDASGNLVARWQAGDQQAARELFHRYTDRLIALVRSRLTSQVGQRVDPEDVVQSAYRSFFAGAGDGQFSF